MGLIKVPRRSSFKGTIHRICKRIGVVAFLLCNTYGAIAQQKYIDLNEFVSTTIANDKTGDLEQEARERLTRRYPNPKDESYWKTAPIVVGINPKAKVQNITILDTTYKEGKTSYSPGRPVLFQKEWNCYDIGGPVEISEKSIKTSEVGDVVKAGAKTTASYSVDLKITHGTADANASFEKDVQTYWDREQRRRQVESLETNRKFTIVKIPHSLTVLKIDPRVQHSVYDVTAISVVDAPLFAWAKNPKTGKPAGSGRYIGDWSSFWEPTRRQLNLRGTVAVDLPPTQTLESTATIPFGNQDACFRAAAEYQNRILTEDTVSEIWERYGKKELKNEQPGFEKVQISKPLVESKNPIE